MNCAMQRNTLTLGATKTNWATWRTWPINLLIEMAHVCCILACLQTLFDAQTTTTTTTTKTFPTTTTFRPASPMPTTKENQVLSSGSSRVSLGECSPLDAGQSFGHLFTLSPFQPFLRSLGRPVRPSGAPQKPGRRQVALGPTGGRIVVLGPLFGLANCAQLGPRFRGRLRTGRGSCWPRVGPTPGRQSPLGVGARSPHKQLQRTRTQSAHLTSRAPCAPRACLTGQA